MGHLVGLYSLRVRVTLLLQPFLAKMFLNMQECCSLWSFSGRVCALHRLFA